MHQDIHYDEHGNPIHPMDPRHPNNVKHREMMLAFFGHIPEHAPQHPHAGDPTEHMAKTTGVAIDPKIIAHALSHFGINGDTIVAHINEDEARLLKEHGGSGTRNPFTGLMQFDDGGGDGGGGDGGGGSGGDGGDGGSAGGDGGSAGSGDSGAGDSGSSGTGDTGSSGTGDSSTGDTGNTGDTGAGTGGGDGGGDGGGGDGTTTPPAPTGPVVPPVINPIGNSSIQIPQGLNPGLIQTTPYYHPTSDIGSKFYWGTHPYQGGHTFDAAAWNNIPNAPAQAWGNQTQAGPQDIAQTLAAWRDFYSRGNPYDIYGQVTGPVAPKKTGS
jgi:hypothetical protein